MNYLLLLPIVLLLVVFWYKISDLDHTNPANNSPPLRFGKVCRTQAGHLVRSQGEKQLANYLFSQNISYLYEPKILGLRPDFYLPEYDLVIEYFGMATIRTSVGQQYRKKMLSKLALYHRNRVKVVAIYPTDLENGSFELKIQQALPLV